ncbi:hypothetical protein FACS1894139_11810 [Planctomycetales bacterium]|nr:hypothetical protein FACS1894108_05050 [Planctomycetales bacterium]GHT06297.1 hypothetical protein FACS1894139_11810 [Planctomycetales bacterium]
MDDTSKILWHPAFCDALQLELRDYSDVLTFEPEHQLNTEPLRIDVLVIKKPAEVVIKKNIGRIFRTHNIVEYKSPDDYLALADFHRGLAYGYLYCAIENITLADLTITFVVSRYPQKVLAYLREQGGKIVEQGSGIYEITGWVMPLQIVIAPELNAEDNLWLKQLRAGLDAQSLERLMKQALRQKSISKFRAYLQVIAQANMATLMEEYQMSAQTLEDFLVESGITAGIEARSEARGEERGEARGEARGKAAIARSMLASDFSLSDIAKFTGLTVAEIERLK